MGQETIITILLALIGTSTAIFTVIVQRKTERIKIIENQLSDKKYQAYAELIGLFYDMLKSDKNSKPLTSSYVQGVIMNSKKDLFIYGSDIVFFKWDEWLSHTSENPDDTKGNIARFLDLMLEIRKDMGNNKTLLTRSDILLINPTSIYRYFSRHI